MARPATRKRTRLSYDERHAQVVDTAARLFAQQGFHGTSIDDLVEATGLQRGGLYHYIGGKKELLFQIHARFIDPLLEDARAIATSGAPPEQALRALAHALMRDIESYRDHMRVFLNEWRTIESEPGWEDVRRHRREFEDVIASVLEDGTRQGVFRVEQPRLATLGLIGMLIYSYQWFDPGGRMSTEEVADRFCDIFLEGIVARPPSATARLGL
jgi:AcrR family transcriptional regulator